eukprot:7383525-Prymnesium_polylepis.1
MPIPLTETSANSPQRSRAPARQHTNSPHRPTARTLPVADPHGIPHSMRSSDENRHIQRTDTSPHHTPCVQPCVASDQKGLIGWPWSRRRAAAGPRRRPSNAPSRPRGPHPPCRSPTT